MRLKRGATVNGVQPECIVGMWIVNRVMTEMGYDFTVTSLTDGANWRKSGSLHLAGLAFDVRIWSIPKTRLTAVVRRLQSELGNEFDVVLERDHIHCEFDPDIKPELIDV